jgi:DNA-binding transcriptional MerR regulator
MNDEPTTTTRLFTISEAAQAVGVSTSTLKRWELQHQIAPRRVANGQRIYSEADVTRLRSLKERNL